MDKKVEKFFSQLILWCLLISILFFLFLSIWQIGFWLKYDSWPSLDFVTLGSFKETKELTPQNLFAGVFSWPYDSWLSYPTSWLGLHRIIIFFLSLLNPQIALLIINLLLLNIIDKHEKIDI